MSDNSLKLLSWGGKNKARVRLHKLYRVSNLKEYIETELGEKTFKPRCLTFAGPTAIFEQWLVNHGITNPNNILTIQTYEKMYEGHCGKEILKSLVNTRKRYLGGMKIWPYNFQSFSKCYNASGEKAVCDYPSKSSSALWSRGQYKGLMNNVINNPLYRFSVLDLDLCGIFNRANASSVVNLFENKALDDIGVLFITHLKGRDVRGGSLYEILLDVLENSQYINFDSMKEKFKEDPTNYSRYVLIPLYYMCKAFDNGYILTLNKLIEYRDKNEDSGLAVNMLQYLFDWVAISKSNVDPEELRLNSMREVLDEEYSYNCWID